MAGEARADKAKQHERDSTPDGEEAGAASQARIMSDMRARGVRIVHVAIPDLDACLRERRLAVDDASAAFGAGASFPGVLHKWDSGEQVTGRPPFVGEAVAVDWQSARDWPFEPQAALVFADYAGPSREFSPREVLKAQLARAAALGVSARAALEFEFQLLDENARALRDKGFENFAMHAPDNRCWATHSAAVHSDYLAGLEAVLDRAGVGLFALGPELGPGCFEATLRAGEPLRAADDAVLFKTCTKAYSRRQGLTASFMARLAADLPGQSGHVHLSLACARSARPLLGPGEGAGGMSETMGQAIAGLVELAPEALALAAHTVNAWRRLAPGQWAPRSAGWAVQNYAAAVRAVLQPQDRARLEFRLPGADTNPYLAMALALAGALHGIESGAVLPPPITGSGPGEAPEGAALPRNLLEAAERLDSSPLARRLFGDRFIDHFVATRRHEDAVLRQHASAFERARYLEVV